MVDPPTFQVPLSFTKGGCRVVEQGSETDLRQCVEASLRTRRGSRTGLPTFGISDQALLQGGADLNRIAQEVSEHEDRVEVDVRRDGLLRDVVDEVRVSMSYRDGAEEAYESPRTMRGALPADRIHEPDQPTYMQLMLSLNPAMYWPLDAEYGTTDLSGNDRHGTGNGGITIGGDESDAVPQGGGSTAFDGINDSVTAPYSPYQAGSVRTIVGRAWRQTSVMQMDWLFGGGTTSAADLELYLPANAQDVQWIIGEDNNNDVLWSNVWPGDAQWVSWAFKWNDGNGDAELFINGISKGVINYEWGRYVAEPGNFKLGSASIFHWWKGKMAHVGIFERGLTPGEIFLLHKAVGS